MRLSFGGFGVRQETFSGPRFASEGYHGNRGRRRQQHLLPLRASPPRFLFLPRLSSPSNYGLDLQSFSFLNFLQVRSVNLLLLCIALCISSPDCLHVSSWSPRFWVGSALSSGLVAVVTQALDSVRGGNGSVVLSTQTKTFVTQMEGSRGLWVSDQKQNPDVNEGETQTKSTRVKKRFLSSVHSVPQPPVSP